MPSKIQDFIDSEAKSLSTRYGLKYEGVKNHLLKAFKHIKYSETIADIDFIRQYLYCFRQAFTNWPKRRAANYYSSHSPDEVLAYASACEYLSELNTPLLSREELKEQTRAIIRFFEAHKTDIVSCGLPKASFPGHPWFDSHLIRTFPIEPYPHKPSLENTRTLHVRCVADDYRSFLENPVAREQSHMGYVDTKLVIGKVGLEYYQGNLINDPPGQASIPIEEFRERFLGLKIDILRILDAALENEHSEDLVHNCIRVIASALSAEDLSFLAKTEGYYSYSRRVSSVPGGFFDLIEVIGHYDNELHSRMYARVKKSLGKLVIPIGFSQVLTVNSFFLIDDKQDARRLNNAVTEFIMLSSNKRIRLGYLWNEVNHLLHAVYQGTKLDQALKADIELFLVLAKKYRESDPHWSFSKHLLQGFTQRQEGSEQNNNVLQSPTSLSDDKTPRVPNPEAILWIETNTNSAFLHGYKLDIEPLTYKLLLVLVNSSAGLVKTYAELAQEVWPNDASEDRYLEKQLMNRKSDLFKAVRHIESSHNLPFHTDLHLLKNIRGKGYVFTLKPNEFDIAFRFKMSSRSED